MQITIPVYTGIEDETQKLRITRSTADAETQLFLSSTAAGHYLLCYRVGRPTLAISVADLIDALAAAQDRPHHSLSHDIRERIQEGAALTREQAVELARFEAAHLGLTLPEAIDRHRAGSLPIDAVGTDLGYLIDMLGLNTQEEHPS